MTQEEKAKAYDEALEKAKKWIENPIVWSSKDICQKLFPRFAESEDERIRRKMLEHFRSKTKETWCNIPVKDIIAYLEKQKEIPEKEYVFRPLAGTDITIAAEQAIRRAKEGDHLVLAFNGFYTPVNKHDSVKRIVDEYDSFIGKQKEQNLIMANSPQLKEQKPAEWNDFEIHLMDCMLAAQQYRQGSIDLNIVKPWAEELSELIEQPKKEWDEFDEDCLKRAIWYVENPAPSVVKDTNLALWLKFLPERFNLQPKQEWSEGDEKTIDDAYCWLCEYAGSLIQRNYGKSSMLYGIANKLKSFRPQKLDASKLDNFDPVDVLNRIKREWPMAWEKVVWKPSEEQMEALYRCVDYLEESDNEDAEFMESLLEQLKKLM